MHTPTFLCAKWRLAVPWSGRAARHRHTKTQTRLEGSSRLRLHVRVRWHASLLARSRNSAETSFFGHLYLWLPKWLARRHRVWHPASLKRWRGQGERNERTTWLTFLSNGTIRSHADRDCAADNPVALDEWQMNEIRQASNAG